MPPLAYLSLLPSHYFPPYTQSSSFPEPSSLQQACADSPTHLCTCLLLLLPGSLSHISASSHLSLGIRSVIASCRKPSLTPSDPLCHTLPCPVIPHDLLRCVAYLAAYRSDQTLNYLRTELGLDSLFIPPGLAQSLAYSKFSVNMCWSRSQ